MDKDNKGKSSSVWKMDKDELNRQVTEYSTLKIYQSVRGISVIILLIGFIASAVFFLLQIVPVSNIFLASAIFTTLLFFIYRGHRWAMILVILSLIFNFLTLTIGRIEEGTFTTTTLLLQGGLLLLIVSYLKNAIVVENHRNKASKITSDQNVDLITTNPVKSDIVNKKAQFNFNKSALKSISILGSLILVVTGLYYFNTLQTPEECFVENMKVWAQSEQLSDKVQNITQEDEKMAVSRAKAASAEYVRLGLKSNDDTRKIYLQMNTLFEYCDINER